MLLPLILLLVLGIKPAPIDDDLIKDFRVNELVDETTTDCTENPSSGGPMDQTLKMELVEPLKPDEMVTTPIIGHELCHQDTTDSVKPMMVPVRPPQPDPQPQPEPPSAITPEPSIFLFTFFGMVFLFFFIILKRLSRA
jgi:hypothetical protein